MSSIKKVCVYCSSSNQIDQSYFQATQLLAETLAKKDIQVVFGGGSAGLMGHLADHVLANDGHAIGVMPHFMKEAEWQHKGVQEFVFVEDMHERKKLLLKDADALITLPGGCGTFEEFFEALTLKRLGLFTKPIIIVNTNNYYAPMIELLHKSIEQRFMAEIHRDMWTVIENPADIISAIESAPSWSTAHFQKAVMR